MSHFVSNHSIPYTKHLEFLIDKCINNAPPDVTSSQIVQNWVSVDTNVKVNRSNTRWQELTDMGFGLLQTQVMPDEIFLTTNLYRIDSTVDLIEASVYTWYLTVFYYLNSSNNSYL